MNKMDDLLKARALLAQAVSMTVNSMPNNHSVQEARMHMKKAINEIDSLAKSHAKKGKAIVDQNHQWWSNVVSGVSAGSHSQTTAQAQHRSLSELNSMIDVEQKKLDELEKEVQKPDPIADLLSD